MLYEVITQYVLTRNDEEIIKNFVDEKYSTWEWNYGYSPTRITSYNVCYTKLLRMKPVLEGAVEEAADCLRVKKGGFWRQRAAAAANPFDVFNG